MIPKNELKGKFVTYRDRHEKIRTGKVTRITGNTVSVKRANGVVERVYKDKIFGRQFRKRGLEVIQWGK